MAENTGSDCSDHGIFKLFANDLKDNMTTRNVMDTKNNKLYVFHFATGNVLSTRAHSFHHTEASPNVQIYEPESKIKGDVTLLRVSENSEHVALVSDLSLYIMKLPHLWGEHHEPKSETCGHFCPLWIIVPTDVKIHKMFVYEVMQLRWHPAYHNQFLVLFNDNRLRLYDAEKKTMLKGMSLGRLPTTMDSIVLGEHAVDFDFVPPTTQFALILLVDHERPVIVVKGNGDVFCASLRANQATLMGPLDVTPNNIRRGSHSACAVLVIDTEPALVVIASHDGRVYHTILLEEKKEPKLQIVEEITLEMGDFQPGPAVQQTHTDLLLLRDQSSPFRYLILHDAGMHAVMVPFMQVIQGFWNRPNLLETGMKQLRFAILKNSSIVKLLLLTMLPGWTSLNPCYGSTFIPGVLMEPLQLILLSHGRTLCFNVHKHFPRVTHHSLFTDEGRTQKVLFKDVISYFLYGDKGTNIPILRLGEPSQLMTADQQLKFIQSQTNAFKARGVKCHTKVLDAIQLKKQLVFSKLKEMAVSMAYLKEHKEQLQANAEIIAEKYEEAKERQLQLESRFEAAGQKIDYPMKAQYEQILKTNVQEMTLKVLTIQKRMEAITSREKTVRFQNMPQENTSRIEPNAPKNEMKGTSGTEMRTPKSHTNQALIYLKESVRKVIIQRLANMDKAINDLGERVKALDSRISPDKRH